MNYIMYFIVYLYMYPCICIRLQGSMILREKDIRTTNSILKNGDNYIVYTRHMTIIFKT